MGLLFASGEDIDVGMFKPSATRPVKPAQERQRSILQPKPVPNIAKPAPVTVYLGRSKVPMRCVECMPEGHECVLWTGPGPEGRWYCDRCGSARIAQATMPEFREEQHRLIAMFAVWRDAIERDANSKLAIEAEIALRWRLGLHDITMPLADILRLTHDGQIVALQPHLMLAEPPARPARPDPNFGSRVTGSLGDARLDAAMVGLMEVDAQGNRRPVRAWSVEHDTIAPPKRETPPYARVGP